MHAASMVSEDGREGKLAIGQTKTEAYTQKCGLPIWRIVVVATSMLMLKTENFPMVTNKYLRGVPDSFKT